MKYLTHYLEQGTTDLMQKHRAFWAIGDKQFEEKKEEGVKYTQLVSGMIVPVEEAKELLIGLNKNLDEAVKKDLEENGIDKIITREIGNHETTYTGDLEHLWEQLSVYQKHSPELTEKKVNELYLIALKSEN